MTATDADQAERERAIHDRHLAALYPILRTLDSINSRRGNELADALSRVIYGIESESAACFMREVAYDETRRRELELRRALGVAELALERAQRTNG